jgi:glutathione S-transferase
MSELTLIIGNKNYSSWSLRPWVFMKQNMISFNEKRIPLFTETTEEALAPYGSDYKVPVLQDGSLIIWDSLSILEYLAEKYPDASGWPEEQQARAMARSVSAEMHSSYVNVRSELPMNCRRKLHNIRLSSNAEREIERIKSLWRTCRMEYGAGGEWLFGKYSIADAMFAPIALRFEGYSIPVNQLERAYVDSVLNQPCIQEWIQAGKAEKEIIEEDEIDG